nr:MAG TPA: hypothetical protein [Caudoviricetes sp.]
MGGRGVLPFNDRIVGGSNPLHKTGRRHQTFAREITKALIPIES